MQRLACRYVEDFEAEGLLARIRCAGPELGAAVAGVSRQADIDYDWARNDAR